MDEVDWIRSCRYTETDEYQAADRLGRMGKAASEGGMQRIQKNSPTRQAIFELMTLFDRKLEEQGFIDLKLANLLALKEAKADSKKRYTHILVDESQDLTRVQMEFVTQLLLPREYASILFVSDSAQSIYAHSWMVRGRSFTSIGFDMTGRSSILSKNYRTTTEISQAAYSLIRWDDVLIEDDNFVLPSLLDRPGLYPVYRACASPAAEAVFVSEEIRRLSTQYAFGDICLLAKTYNQLQEILTVLERDGIPVSFAKKGEEPDFGSDTVKLLTIHSAKGLEFKVVFLIGLNKKIIPYVTYQEMEDRQVQIRTERKLMYVGMTRANELPYLSSVGIPSPFVEELDPKCLRLVPFLFAEIKAKGSSLDEAVTQVRSYMAHAEACQFGVATDGCDVSVVMDLMRKQDTAQTRDIVAVALSDEATLKRYVKMGDSILLMPENEAYEPIQVRDNEARILGVAIGLLKRV